MSYRVGHMIRKLARDYVGVEVVLLRRHETRGGSVWAEGERARIVEVWKGRLLLERLSGHGDRISGVSGFDVRELPAEPEPPGG